MKLVNVNTKYLTINGKRVQVEDRGDGKLRLWLQEYNPQLQGELKESGGKYEKPTWVCKRSPRLGFLLDLLSGGKLSGISTLYSNQNSTEYATGRDLWEHQKRALQFKVQRRRCIDAGEMGVGKTLSTMVAIEILRQQWNGIGTLWWVAPNSALISFRTQARKFKFQLTSGDKLFNYHSLEQQMISAKEPPRFVVFDESSNLKNASARRTQLAIALTEEMEKRWGNECTVYLLSGTPAPQNPFDWWAQCEVCRPGWLKESTIYKFQRRLANWTSAEKLDGSTYPVLDSWKSAEIELLPKRLEGLVLVTWKKDCLDLPEKVYEEIQLETSSSTLRVARAITRSGLPAAQVQSRLRQLSDGFQYTETNDAQIGATPKDQAVKDLLEEHQEIGRIVIYAAFTASVDRVVELCRKNDWAVWRLDGRGSLGMDCAGSEEEFQDTKKDHDSLGRVKPIAFVGNPEAGSMGLTLTPSPIVVFYSNSFKSQFRIQAEDRIHRPGASKERGCRIIDLIHLPTDLLVLNRLKEKRDVEFNTLEEIEQCLAVV